MIGSKEDIRIFDLQSQQITKNFKVTGGTLKDMVDRLAFSPNGISIFGISIDRQSQTLDNYDAFTASSAYTGVSDNLKQFFNSKVASRDRGYQSTQYGSVNK